jgi:hypothetical protein
MNTLFKICCVSCNAFTYPIEKETNSTNSLYNNKLHISQPTNDMIYNKYVIPYISNYDDTNQISTCIRNDKDKEIIIKGKKIIIIDDYVE